MSFCFHCNDKTEYHIVENDLSMPVKGEIIQIRGKIPICNICGNEVSHEQLEQELFETLYNEYRRKHHYLFPDEIESHRKRYGLSQENLARLFGWGEVTVTRYEGGSLPDKGHHTMLKLLESPSAIQKIFESNGMNIPDSQREKVRRKIIDEVRNEMSGQNIDILEQNFSVDLFTGLRIFSRQTLESMMLFFAAQHGGVFKTKLNKLLFYADFTHFNLFGISLSGASYIKLQYGPVPDKYEYYLSLLQLEKMIKTEIPLSGDMIAENLESNVKPDELDFNQDALKVLEAVNDYFKHMGSRQISELSHKEPGYIETLDKKAISYEYAKKLIVKISV